jgi:hypothetical protein
MPEGSRIKEALADNTAQLKVLADRYVSLMAYAEKEIEKEQAKPQPSQWKIESLTHIRERAHERLARFKAGPERLPDYLHPTNDSE